MKSILSPYNDIHFNEFVVSYIKKRYKQFLRKYGNHKYKTNKEFTANDIINSLYSDSHVIGFRNQDLVNHAVYDLGQRFWYEEMVRTNSIMFKLYLQYRKGKRNDKFTVQS